MAKKKRKKRKSRGPAKSPPAQKKPKLGKPPPQVLSMIVCDSVIKDQFTGKLTLVGLFTNVWAPSFPAVHSQLAVHVEMTNGHGDYECRLGLSRADTGVDIGSIQGPVTLADPLAVGALTLRLTNLVFPKAGEYRFELYIDGTLLTQRRIMVRKPEPKKEGK